MSHASYRVINPVNSHPVPRSQRYGIPRILQQERIIKTITRTLSALNAKPTIVAFAIACKALERPVLDALWESQDDWFQLLKCFPSDVWEERDNAFVSRCSFATVYPYSIFIPFVNPILALPPQSNPSRVGSFQEICVEDGPSQYHAFTKIHIDPLFPNLEYGSQQLSFVPKTSNHELEDGVGFRPVHLLIPLTQPVIRDDLLHRRQLQRSPGTCAIQPSQ